MYPRSEEKPNTRNSALKKEASDKATRKVQFAKDDKLYYTDPQPNKKT